jgi:hypothetical protein
MPPLLQTCGRGQDKRRESHITIQDIPEIFHKRKFPCPPSQTLKESVSLCDYIKDSDLAVVTVVCENFRRKLYPNSERKVPLELCDSTYYELLPVPLFGKLKKEQGLAKPPPRL